MTRIGGNGAAAAWSAVVATWLVVQPAQAQISVRENPSVRTSDRLNVDVTTGLPQWVVPDVGIGPENLGFRHHVRSEKASFWTPRDDYKDSVILEQSGNACSIQWAGWAYLVSYRGVGECFYLDGGVFTSFDGKGARLEAVSGGYIYTLSDGTRVHYSTSEGVYGYGLKKVEQPDGVTTRVFYEYNGSRFRVRSVEKNTGYRLYYRYRSDDPGNSAWSVLQGVAAYNAAHEGCQPGSQCSFSLQWPSSSYVRSEDDQYITTSIIDEAGLSTDFLVDKSYQFNNLGRFNRVKLPTSDVPDITYEYCPYNYDACTIWSSINGSSTSVTINDLVISASQNGLTWTYGLAPAGPYNLQRNSTGPNGYLIDLRTTNSGNLQTLSTPEGGYTFSGGTGGLVTSAPNPDGTTSSFVRDGRGNITEVRRGGAVEQTMTYPPTCENRITCNRPVTVTDANGNQIVYEYHPVHGGVVRATGPTVGGVTRETRYVYEQRHAWVLGTAGTPVQDPDPVWVLVQEKTCRTGPASGAGCAIPGDELRTVYERGPENSVNNLLVRGVVRDADGIAARTCYAYDRFGNRISETSAAAQSASCS